MTSLPAGLTEADVERADKRACRLDGLFRDLFNREERADILRAALTATIGDRVVVPREPTVEMRKAGVDADDKRTGNETCAHIYRAMIAAAPGTKP